ncbi:MAG: hypothetical protein WBH08_03820 [Methanothrix sp.]|uniref:hypothetical protein n=1 Tax=Methanothrix sp. TaxID=90426 RepID=UPI003BB63A14
MTVGRKGTSRQNILRNMTNEDRRRKRKQEQRQRKYSQQNYDKPVASEAIS